MPEPRWGLLLINLGTTAAPRPGEVRRYLREFLSDPRVLDIPALWRAFILNVFILPSRPRLSAEAYEKIWTERGSPLLFHSLDLRDKVRRLLGTEVPVELGMRYQQPSIEAALTRLRQQAIDRIVVLPLFPQYSSAAFGSALERVFKVSGALWDVPFLRVVPPFFDHPAFLDAFAAVARPILEEFRPDRVLQSFHGLPERQVRKSDASGGRHCLVSPDCCATLASANRNCYRAQCFATARGLAERLGLAGEACQVCFQSRLGSEPWIRPFTDELVVDLARSGARRVAVLCPAFVADCLETLEEIAIRARDSFRAQGGEELRLVSSLNSSDLWAEAVARLARENAGVVPQGACA